MKLEFFKRPAPDQALIIRETAARRGFLPEDVMGSQTTVELPGFAPLDTFEKFRDKARAFLREHQDHLTIQKLRMNQPLKALELEELQRMLAESGVANPDHLQTAKANSDGLGLFVRSLVGLDREAA